MILASSCRRRIMRILISERKINVMKLVQKTNSTYNQINSNLKILKKQQIIFDDHVGYRRIITLNSENPGITDLSNILKILSKKEYKRTKNTKRF